MALPEQYIRATVEEYLQHERESPERCEYLDGQIYQMAGESYEHSTINANVIGCLGIQLKGKPCCVLSPSLMISTSPQGLFAFPDALILCSEPKFYGKGRNILLNPTILIEISSPSTENYDRIEKFRSYKQIPSLTNYLICFEKRPHVEHFTRQGDGTWLLDSVEGLDAIIRLPFIDCSLQLAEVYDRIEFPEMIEETASPLPEN